MSGHRPSRTWEGPKKAGAKSRGRTRRFFCFCTELYLAIVGVDRHRGGVGGCVERPTFPKSGTFAATHNSQSQTRRKAQNLNARNGSEELFFRVSESLARRRRLPP